MLATVLRRRVYLLIAAHLLILAFSYRAAFVLRFDSAIPVDMDELFWDTLPLVLGLKLALLMCLGSLHGWWRHVTFSDLASLLSVSTVSLTVIASIDYFFIYHFQIPRAVLLLDWGATVLLLGGLRSVWRLTHEHVLPSFLLWSDRHPVLVIGAGLQGDVLARLIHRHPSLNYRVVGFLDEDASHVGSKLGGIPFLGRPDQLMELCHEYEVSDVLVMANSLPGAQLREIEGKCRETNKRVKIVPPVDSMLSGEYRLNIRDVDINDLLRRPPVELNSHVVETILKGRRVMVTGAGGSIGSEICRQILRHGPANLLLVERAENSLFHIERELAPLRGSVDLVPCIADIRDEERMQTLFRQYRPQLVFHCAAHKHVPLMESNPGEAIKNNILGTMAIADLSDEFHIDRFVMISTDKAVNPTSVMGVSKRMAERYVHAFSESSRTKFVVVRFGNVLASAGSVVPIFQEQIRRGGPLTVTHPEMTRYFMTIPEASQLVLQAAAMGRGGEIFVLDMGEPVKIMDLARDLIRLSGFGPDDIEIRITGLRPGEKLYEELYFEEEQTLETNHPKLRVAFHRSEAREDVLAAIDSLRPVAHSSPDAIREALAQVTPEYQSPNGRRPQESVACIVGATKLNLSLEGI